MNAVALRVRSVEEPHLRRLHGRVYDDYAAQVGRFVPILGRMPDDVPRRVRNTPHGTAVIGLVHVRD